jgi:hypothetical protein
MSVESRDLVNLGERQPHLLRQRSQMRSRKMPVTVLDQVQMLDQEVTLARALTQQRPDLVKRLRVDLAALGGASRTPGAVDPAVCKYSLESLWDAHWGSPRPTQSPSSYLTIEIFYRLYYVANS